MEKGRRRQVVIVGAGDVAARLVRIEQARWQRLGVSPKRSPIRWLALVRSAQSAARARAAGMLPIAGDLDHLPTLRRAQALAREAFSVLYLAPPPNAGSEDPRMRRWLAMPRRVVWPRRHGNLQLWRMLRSKALRTRRRIRLNHVYVSTTGVYGDCAGERIDETRRVRPQTDRAKRRVAAERCWRKAGRFGFAPAAPGPARGAVVLRAPGIYALERLPLERLRARLPVLVPEEDVYTNHIHADDLARAIWRAVFRGRPGRVYNAVDEAAWTMGEYFDRVADAFHLPRPPRLPRRELQQQISPILYSFMTESRRIDNRRLRVELGLRLRYPTPSALLGQEPISAADRSDRSANQPAQGRLF
ncbi:MAG: SDR family NAD(P)-dependent oxidoreductase [Casimicrobiaceae bacterium]|nr:SDR family NAD(P)-dependent oxidoreductase [Casimicrobiaceae bacterium]